MKTSFKKIVIPTVIACILAGCNAIEKKANNIKSKDPVIERADIVYDAGPGLTPFIVRAPNGDLIVSISTEGDGMPTQGDTMKFVRSSDMGKTWSKPYMTSKTDKPLTGLGEQLFMLPAGRILRYSLELVWPEMPDFGSGAGEDLEKYLSVAAGRKFDSYYSISDDNGYTFSERKLLCDPVKRNDFAQGNIVTLPNGDLLWSWGYWEPEPLNGFKRSTDGGLTWGPMERAYQDPPPGFTKPLGFNETGVAVCKDGTIVAIARVDGAPGNDKRFWQIKSSDNGKTWSVPQQIDIAGGSPAMYCTPQGQLWLAYRDGGFGPGLGLAASDDNGDTWRFLYHLKDPTGELERRFGYIRYTDEDRKLAWRPYEGLVGYPTFAKLSENEVYVVYHSQNMHIPPRDKTFIAGNLLRIP